jgi:hypothetical protein
MIETGEQDDRPNTIVGTAGSDAIREGVAPHSRSRSSSAGTYQRIELVGDHGCGPAD